MKILIDGDSCCRTDMIIHIAQKYKIPVHIYCDVNHYTIRDDAEIHVVDQGMDSADFAIANHTNKSDIVVTNDAGLASIILAKKASCLNTKGIIFTNQNIDRYMHRRYMTKQMLQKSHHRYNPNQHKQQYPENQPSFYESLHHLIRKNLEKRKED